jgi:dipeptidyl aminopeptidase/acylaminoacyl peptidase
VSPTHLVLALAAAMVFSGPIRSVAYRYGPESTGWAKVGPVVPALAAAITLVGFFSQYAQPIGDDGIASVVAKSDTAPVVRGLYSMHADGSDQRRLFAASDLDFYAPSVSPDGKYVTYRVGKSDEPTSDIYVARIDGSHARRITHSGRHDTQPAWSPDGNRIAFVSDRDGNLEIYVMNADGSQPVRLTNNSAIDWFPAWSPDGAHLAFVSFRDANLEIYAMNVDGTQQTRLTQTSTRDYSPAWSPDGTEIAFNSERDGNFEIYLMRPDGSQQLRLTTSPAAETLPDWLPRESGTAAPIPMVTLAASPYVPTATVTPSLTRVITATPTATVTLTVTPTTTAVTSTVTRTLTATVTSTVARTPTITRTPSLPPAKSAVTPTAALPKATTTPAAAPGLYANLVQTDPRDTKSGQTFIFDVNFLNTTGGTVYVKWFVKIYKVDERNSFGETAKVTSTVPSGTTTQATLGDWRTNVGVCTTFIARVFGVDASSNITEFTRSDGNSAATNFTMCP